MTKHTPARTQRRLVELWHRSDLSMSEFARRHDVRPGTFATWVARHRPSPPSLPAFLPLPVPDEPAASSDAATEAFAVRLGEHCLRFDAPPPPTWFAAVLRELVQC